MTISTEKTAPEAAVLLINTGSPDAPTTGAVRRYLAEFLSDPRIVELPRWQWMPILHGIILRTRPAKSAKRYQGVWTDRGSPLIVNCEDAAEKLNAVLGPRIIVKSAMRYGNPSIAEAIDAVLALGVRRVLLFPMFAQYAAQTSAACIDAAFAHLSRLRSLPAIRTVREYHTAPEYIEALAQQVLAHWARAGRLNADGQRGKLLMSFHGIPKKSSELGDTYEADCKETAALLAQRLGLSSEEWGTAFQSRFGRDEWLQPYSIDVVKDWAAEGVSRIDVICPGFAADCLETIEEIGDELGGIYRNAHPNGVFHYIPALNAGESAIDAYAAILRRELSGWI